MSTTGLTIRTMTREEMPLALEWAAQEGWNPGLHDADCFYLADPNGFFIALQETTPVGCISAVAYGQQFGFIGFFIVVPSLRGGRIGIELGRRALKYLEGRVIGLDGVEAKIHNYQDLGFTLAYANMRYEGTAQLTPTSALCAPLQAIPFHELLAYDQPFFPAPRDTFLRQWISRPGTLGYAVRTDSTLRGYGVIRPCRKGYKIGPLFADNPDVAEDLFRALTSSVPAGLPVYLDIPGPNQDAINLVQRHQMKQVFRTARMYQGPAPDLPLHRLYGVTSFELG